MTTRLPAHDTNEAAWRRSDGPDEAARRTTEPLKPRKPLRLLRYATTGVFSAPRFMVSDRRFYLLSSRGYDAVASLTPATGLRVLVDPLGGGGGAARVGIPLPSLGRRGRIAYYDCNFGGTWFVIDVENGARFDLPRGAVPDTASCRHPAFDGFGVRANRRGAWQRMGDVIYSVDLIARTATPRVRDPALAGVTVRSIVEDVADDALLVETVRGDTVRLLRYRSGSNVGERVRGLPSSWRSLLQDPTNGLLYLHSTDGRTLYEADPAVGVRAAVALPADASEFDAGDIAPATDGVGRSLYGLHGVTTATRRFAELRLTLPLVSGSSVASMVPWRGAVEGQAVTLSVPSAPAAAQVRWEFSHGAGIDGPPTITHRFPDDGRYDVRAIARRGRARDDTTRLQVNVENAAPRVQLRAPPVVESGQAMPTLLSFRDDGILDAPWNWTVRVAGVESTTVSEGVAVRQRQPVVVSLRVTGEGARWVTAAVTDKDGATGRDSVAVRVVPRVMTVRAVPDGRRYADQPDDTTASFLRVAVLTRAGFDATQLLVPSFTITDGRRRWGPARRANGLWRVPVRDVNGDGRPDVVVLFPPDAARAAETSSLRLSARFPDGSVAAALLAPRVGRP